MCQVWCSGIEGIYALIGGRSASTSAKFSVAVLKASMLESGGTSAKIYHVWCSSIEGICQ